MKRLRWPLMCFVAVAFWNMIGAGVFGFLINPPISLFYLQGLNTTAVHAPCRFVWCIRLPRLGLCAAGGTLPETGL